MHHDGVVFARLVCAGDAWEVTTDDTEIVSALHRALADRVGTQRFELWFGSSVRFALEDDRLTVLAPSLFLRDWIAANFRSEIAAACAIVLGKCPHVDFAVAPTVDNTPRDAGSSRQSENPTNPAVGLPALVQDHGDRRQTAADVPDADPPAPNRRNDRHWFTFDTFVVGPSNKTARTAAEMILDQPGMFSPLLIHGPTSVGKTHLLQSILAAARRRRLGASAVYLTAEQFTTHFIEALRGSGLPNFREKYRGVKLLAIDDLQFFRGKRSTLVELLYTVDTLVRRRQQLVFAADRPLAELGDLGPELVARLAAGNQCPIGRPDYAARLGIVDQMARRFNLSVPREVCEFIAARLTNHAREISGALCRLQATSTALGRPINLGMAQEALAEMIRHSHRVVRLTDIQKAVCDVFGIEPESLQAGRRAKRVSQPRMLAMWLARKHTRAALSEIGHFFGRRSHSTVVSAQKRVDAWLADNQEIELADHMFRVDDAIQRVERMLQAG
ncbi:MAG: chromosomal replication initiator protein DnaA [Pirellulales bacterium]|nr:chromosomal replication initiator protein DnaA [Pirellulales bacterium]